MEIHDVAECFNNDRFVISRSWVRLPSLAPIIIDESIGYKSIDSFFLYLTKSLRDFCVTRLRRPFQPLRSDCPIPQTNNDP